MRIVIRSLFIALVLCASSAKAFSFNCSQPGAPEFIRVIDGDTVEVRLAGLPEHLSKIKIRIYGVDTAEKDWRAECPEEAAAGLAATAFTKSLFNKAVNIRYHLMKWDKYGGRVNGDVYLDGVSLSNTLIQKGYAVPYFGGKKENSWCK